MANQAILQIVLQVVVALGTLAVAVLAIWGDWFRDRLASPKLELRLRDSRGNPTSLNGRRAIYYHLVVQNKRRWALATGVQVMINGIWRRAADGTFKPEILAAELPLTWAFPQFTPINPKIRDRKVCDLGFLAEGDKEFKPSLYFYPNNFRGFVKANDSIRLSIGIQAENFTSHERFVVEISWDGVWDSDLDQMEKHLVVKEVQEHMPDSGI